MTNQVSEMDSQQEKKDNVILHLEGKLHPK